MISFSQLLEKMAWKGHGCLGTYVDSSEFGLNGRDGV